MSYLEDILRGINRYKLIYLAPFLIYFVAFFNQWHFQDDHEIAFFNIFLRDHSFWETLKLTEVFQWGEFKRFRPSYYSLKILETYLFGDHLFLWHLLRIIIQLFFLHEVYAWAKRYLSLEEVTFVTLIALSMIFWRDLQPRLGPGENYCVLGVSLISLSLRRNRFKPLYLLGGLLAIGSKENFVITPVFLSCYFFWNKRLTKLDGLFLFILYGASLFLGIGILKALSQSGTDLYAQSVSPIQRIVKLALGLISIQLTPYLLLVGGHFTKKIKLNKDECFLMLLFGFVIGVNLVFYNGKIVHENRYDFPSLPLNLWVWGLCYLKFKSFKFVRPAIAFIMSFFILSGVYRQITKTISRHKQSIAFTDSLEKAANEIKDYSEVVIVTNNEMDLEPVIFLPRYFMALGLKQAYYLKAVELSPQSSYEKDLARQIKEVSSDGLPFQIKSWEQVNSSTCIQLNFNSNIAKKFCSRVYEFETYR